MKLTKKQEQEIMQVYEAYWAEYLNGNVKGIVPLLDASYTQVGSAESEVFSSKKEAVQFLVDTIDQVSGKLEMRNRSTKLEMQDHFILIHELCDLYALADKKWVFYSKFRASTLLQEKKEGYKITHQHSSFPDTKTEEGQNVAIEKIAAENQHLREAVKRRTVELEQKNQELQIEAALERVRARAMAMQRSDELSELVDTVFKELTKLDLALSWCMINIIDEPSMSNMVWGANPEIGKEPESYHMFFEDYRFHDEMFKAWKEKQSKWVFVLKGDEKVIYDEYLFNQTEFRRVPKPVQKQMRATKQYVASFTFSNFGGLQTVGEEPLSAESLDILNRFGKVFDLTYTRFNDLQKAEAQARESEIELALERVRARTMAMQHSDELQEASFLLDQQVRALGIKTWGCAFNIYGEKDSTEWFGNEAGVLPTYTVPRAGIFKEYYQKGQKGESLIIKEFSGKACVDHYEYMSSLPVIGDVLKNLKKTNNGFPTYQLDHVVYFKYGYLLFITKEHASEAHDVFKRFAKVFEQTYTRFLDLQKAEAQAREAQIEAALEKVRSRSLAVHKSDEFNDVVSIVFEKLKELQIPATAVGIAINIEGSKDLNSFVCGENEAGLVITNYRLPYFNNKISKDISKVLEKQLDLYVGHYSKKVKNSFYNYLIEHTAEFKHLPEDIKGMIFESPSYTISMVAAKHSVFNINDFEGKYLSENDIDILKRFTKVFDQAYIRFLDLNKAEAQAREAQIETALERVRSQSMGMQTSKDLSNVTTEMFKQLRQFDGDLFATGIVFCDKHKGHVEQWHSIPNAGMMSPFIVPIDLDYIHQYRYDQWKKGTELFSIEIPSDFIDQHFNDIFKLPSAQKVLKDFEDQNTPMPEAPSWEIDYGASFKHGYVLVSSLQPFEEAQILPRFAKVFEQTYTRFLDLQKAEAQAREAQIENALEKVRSRTMAMHKSEELAETALVLYEQFSVLGNIPDRMSIGIFKEETKEIELWPTDQSGSQLDQKFTGSWVKSANMTKIYEAWKADNDSFIVDLSGQKLKTWLKFIREEIKLFVDDSHIMGRRVQQAAFFSHGMLLFTTNEPIADEIMQLLIRFARVFSQTYTRFLDLQKAEAQAREAQIETALERVRSRSMAMHKSDELKDVVKVIFDQMTHLKINADHAGIVVDYEPKKDFHFWVADNQDIPARITVPYLDLVWDKQFTEAKKKGKDFFTTQLDFEEKNSFYKKLLPHIKGLTKQARDFYLNCPGLTASTVIQKDIGLYIENFSGIPFSDEEDSILIRFGKVFQQTYTRFLDLQKAEAQARESQIEMALEKVRSRTMAMQNSRELPEAANNLFLQVQELGIPAWSAGYCIWEGDQKSASCNMSSEGEIQKSFSLPTIGEGYNFYKPYKKGEPFYVAELGGKKLVKHYDFMKTLPVVGEIFEEFDNKGISLPTFQIFHIVYFTHGYLMFITYEPVLNDWNIFKRFGKVFEQTFTRFLDLQIAEAQARESQIEAALEKVRSRSLAMHQSTGMQQVANELHQQLLKLELDIDALAMSGVIHNESDYDVWVGGENYEKPLRIPYNNDTKVQRDYNKAIKERPELFTKTYKGKIKDAYFEHLMATNAFNPKLKKMMSECSAFSTSLTFMKNSGIQIIRYNDKEFSDADNIIVQRFGKVFEQAYIRFLDLQKAEAQTREAQIEAALEKVRSRSLAMHKSEELREVVLEVHEKFQELDISMESRVAVIVVFEEDSRNYNQWIASDDFSNMYISTPYFKHKVLDDFWKAKHEGLDFYSGAYSEGEKNSYFQTFFEISNYTRTAEIEVQAQWVYDQKFYAYSPAFQKNSSVGIADFSGIPLTEGEIEIIKRFSKVFEQAYIRFLDLQKAEAQAREAQIEGALERVRSKTMAMHNSEDLEDIVVSLFDEVLNLGLDKSIRCGIGILEGHEGMETRSVNSNSDGSVDLKVGMLNMTIHPMLVGLKKAWKKGSKRYSYEYTGKDVRKYYEALNNEPEYPFNANLETLPEQEFHRSFFYSSGILFTFSETPISEESARILERFAAVFGQTYRRFLDLQTAEAQAREATKQASLDRVRGQIASMRSTADLNRITPLVWNELTTMGVPFIRCGVFIIDEPTEIVQAYLSAPDGHSLGVLHLRFNADPMTESTVTHWRKGSIFKKHWNQEEFISWTQSLMEQGQISDKNTYQDAADPPESLDLHFIPFTQGMLYVGDENPLNDEQIDLVQSLADAFAIAYARYEDFTKLEKAKQSVETTLSELKATQNQLVQSEKMASLGELTAGIAHEIQNPLNFVNNFSEVSNELIDEMNEEIEKGDLDEAKAIASDIKQNLEKINHHGKRADGIVKGMLQHSRSSSGQKEPTDINALADEYLRLAYHGLRAKDKSFNATMNTGFDKTIGSINVVPQDLGRVILNLLTNAFYIVNEKKQMNIEGYKPTVSVSTKKEENHIIISVQDNGNGIPKKVLEKIFQPFFTTKPTGQGTGLGLSMSYDIITKGHGGELKVKTKENLGSTFIISLPQI